MDKILRKELILSDQAQSHLAMLIGMERAMAIYRSAAGGGLVLAPRGASDGIGDSRSARSFSVETVRASTTWPIYIPRMPGLVCRSHSVLSGPRVFPPRPVFE
jgi:hypothetical protein